MAPVSLDAPTLSTKLGLVEVNDTNPVFIPELLFTGSLLVLFELLSTKLTNEGPESFILNISEPVDEVSVLATSEVALLNPDKLTKSTPASVVGILTSLSVSPAKSPNSPACIVGTSGSSTFILTNVSGVTASGISVGATTEGIELNASLLTGVLAILIGPLLGSTIL